MTRGDLAAGEQLVPLVYHELRRLAAHYMRRERPDHTLQPTALVHEAYIRLAGQQADWRNRAHFLGIAAQQMSRVLKDYARKHHAAKRGGAGGKISIDSPDFRESGPSRSDPNTTALSVQEALERLAKEHPRQAEVARLRYFAGSTENEIAEVLKLSADTIRNDWRFAKAWLKAELG
jgi:RNA polymerase sigma factor (TIGR02999 family)